MFILHHSPPILATNTKKKERDQYKDHVRTARDERHMNDIVSRMALK
jgi:hypothetical protein